MIDLEVTQELPVVVRHRHQAASSRTEVAANGRYVYPVYTCQCSRETSVVCFGCGRPVFSTICPDCLRQVP